MSNKSKASKSNCMFSKYNKSFIPISFVYDKFFDQAADLITRKIYVLNKKLFY